MFLNSNHYVLFSKNQYKVLYKFCKIYFGGPVTSFAGRIASKFKKRLGSVNFHSVGQTLLVNRKTPTPNSVVIGSYNIVQGSANCGPRSKLKFSLNKFKILIFLKTQK